MNGEKSFMQLSEVACLNPGLSHPLKDSDVISFLSMADVTTEGATSEGDDRRYADVSKGYTAFECGDLLVAKITPCFENGKIVQAKIKHKHGFGSTEFHVIRPNPECLDARYLLHLLRQLDVRTDGARKMTGSAGHRRVPISFFAGLKIFLPSLAEQKRIAAMFDQLDLLRINRRISITKIGELTRSIFMDSFGDPVVNSMGLPILKLGLLGRLDRGVSKHRPRNAPELMGGDYPLIQTGEVARCDGYLTSYTSTYSDCGLLQSKMWPAGTLCITIAANIAKTGILKFDACFPDSIVGFTADDRGTVEYVRVWLSFLQKNLEENAPSSAQKNINLAVLRALDIPVPSLEERHTFASRISSLEKVKTLNRNHLVQLDTLFASLQHRAFRGEL